MFLIDNLSIIVLCLVFHCCHLSMFIAGHVSMIQGWIARFTRQLSISSSSAPKLIVSHCRPIQPQLSPVNECSALARHVKPTVVLF